MKFINQHLVNSSDDSRGRPRLQSVGSSHAWADDKFKLVISSEIIKEIIKTLMNFKIKLPFDEILLWLSIFLWKAELVEPEERVDVVKDDPDDNKFIEAAIVENADYI